MKFIQDDGFIRVLTGTGQEVGHIAYGHSTWFFHPERNVRLSMMELQQITAKVTSLVAEGMS